MAPEVTRYHSQLLSFIISEKTNDPILRKLSDGQTDGQTDAVGLTSRVHHQYNSIC